MPLGALLILVTLYNYLITLRYFQRFLLFHLKTIPLRTVGCCLTTLSRQRLLPSPSSLIQTLDWHWGRHYTIVQWIVLQQYSQFLKASLCEMLSLGIIHL